jgi:alpha-ribazole phosphatase
MPIHMMTIYLIPVGKTDLSPNWELLGINNPPLSQAGRSQAEESAEMLRPVVLEAVFSGPLKRETETAEKIAHLHSMPIRTDRDLMDINYGSWCGHSWPEIEDSYARMVAKFHKSPGKFKFPVGDKMKKGGKRIQAFATRILANYGTGNLAVVANDLVIYLLASQMAKVELSRVEPWMPSEGKISILECHDGKCIIKSLRGVSW